MADKMFLHALFAFVPVGVVGALVPADPTITPAAILPRQNNDQFIGWLQYNSTWYSETCDPGLTWYQNGKYAQCCGATRTSCYAANACKGGTLYFPLSEQSTTLSIPCTSNFNNTLYSICNTALIFENTADSDPRTNIICGASSLNWSYYRKLDATLTNGSPATGVPMPTDSSNPSKAWIAGAVIGPILGLALIGAIVWCLLRRRKNKKLAPQQGSAAMSMEPFQPVGVAGGYTDAKPQLGQQQQPYTPAPYATQGAYDTTQQTYGGGPQQGYGIAPISPGSQYNAAGAPYGAQVSPPPHGQELHGTSYSPGSSELGGGPGSAVLYAQGTTNYQGIPNYQAAPNQPPAELGTGPAAPATQSPQPETKKKTKVKNDKSGIVYKLWDLATNT